MKSQNQRLRQYTYLRLGLYSLGLLIVIILLTALSLSNDYRYLLDVIRLDKYEIHKDIFRYLLAFFSVILSGLLVIKYGIGRRFILLPSFLFFMLLTVLVYPGVIMIANDGPQGNLAAYGYIVCLMLFSVGVVTATALLRYRPIKEVDLYYNKLGESQVIDSLARKWVIVNLWLWIRSVHFLRQEEYLIVLQKFWLLV